MGVDSFKSNAYFSYEKFNCNAVKSIMKSNKMRNIISSNMEIFFILFLRKHYVDKNSPVSI